MKDYRNLIDGQWIETSDGDRLETTNPANAEEKLGAFPRATQESVKEAIEAARQATTTWAQTPPPERGAILDTAAQLIDARLDDLAVTLTREEGKTLAEATGEVTRARDIFRYYAGEGWRISGDVLPSNTQGEMLYTRREPLGVIGVITPWNYPIAIPAWKIAPALAYGNTVVFKPASDTPLIAHRLVEILVEAGIPSGVLNFITGSGRFVGDALVSSPDIDGISFTGSYEIGVEIYEKTVKNMTRVQLEMGGKNPLVVLQDADLELAVQLAIKGGFGVTGQACTATSRVIVEETVADAFVRKLNEAARALKVGDGLADGTEMGPLVSAERLETVLEYVQVGQDEGADLRTGGGEAGDGGFYVQPTVFDGVQSKMRIAQEEIFGPVIGVLRVHDFDEALGKANDIGFGLSASVVTNDLQRAMHFADRVEAGVVKVNESTTGLALQAPFGGFKHSSANTFKEQGQAAIEFYTRTKTIYLGYEG